MIIDNVLKNHICSGCGTCYGVCPDEAIAMTESLDGRLEPSISKIACNECGLCNTVCPQIQSSKRMDAIIENSATGTVIEGGFLGKPTDESLILKGQTCGMVRNLLIYAIKSGYVNYVVCVIDDKKSPLRPVVEVLREIDQLRSVARSKYCPVNYGQAIKHILNMEGSCLVVGLGCQIQGLTLAMEKLPLLRKRVKLKIGLFCDRILKFGAVDFLLKRTSFRPESVASFDYRHKQWRGWPGDIRIVGKKGVVAHLDRRWRLSILEYFTPVSCRLCVDKLNILSDISVGDPWGVELANDVCAAVIPRTRAGRAFLLDAEQAQAISLYKIDADRVARGQNAELRIKNIIKYKNIMEKKGYEVPSFLKARMFSSNNSKRGCLNSVYMWFGLFSETVIGAKISGNIPVWVPHVSYFIKKTINFNHRIYMAFKRRVKKMLDR